MISKYALSEVVDCPSRKPNAIDFVIMLKLITWNIIVMAAIETEYEQISIIVMIDRQKQRFYACCGFETLHLLKKSFKNY